MRSGTADLHAAVERQSALHDLRTGHGYTRFLSGIAAALLPLESMLEDSGVWLLLPDWTRRRRSDAILADLASLRCPARPLSQPQAVGFFGLLGTLYVLEGSRLGARVLLQTVRGAAQSSLTTRYLDHGQDPRLWTSFLSCLERQRPSAAEQNETVQAARNAFELFEEGFRLA